MTRLLFSILGKHSQSGFTSPLLFLAESSAESELYALASARKAARNFRLLMRESFSTSIVMSLRCDNTATIATLEEPGWRTRYISIYGEAARQEVLNRTMILTYVSTDCQLADPLTKPTTAAINARIYSMHESISSGVWSSS